MLLSWNERISAQEERMDGAMVRVLEADAHYLSSAVAVCRFQEQPSGTLV